MCSTESICENKKEMDDSGFVPDLCAQDVLQCSQHVNLLDLSDDVLLYILRHCTPRDLKALGFACTRLGRLVRERALWRRVDARAEACSKARFKWLLDNVLHADTRLLLLTGYARDADGCIGLINVTRKEAETELKARSHDENSLNGHATIEAIRTNLPTLNMGGMERRPARLVISAQRTQLPRHRCFPSWPEDGEVGRAGPQRCSGPQFTLSQPLLQQLCTKCPQLTTLGLEYCNIDCSNTGLGTFPRTLKKLSLRGTKCYNMTFDKSFLFKIQDYLPILESLDVSECEWMDPATLLPLSKMAALEELIMQDCHKLAEFVAYASLTARYGFRVLKSLDLRGSPVGDSEVSALGWLPQLEKLWLSARRQKRANFHAHYVDDERAKHTQLHEWESQEPDYFKQKSNPDTSMEDMGSGMGEPIPSSDITDEDPDTNNERSQSKDKKGNEGSKEESDKRGSKRKPDKGTGDDTENGGEPSCKRRRTGVKISFENNTVTKRVLPVIENEDGYSVFDESDESYNGNGENIVIRNRNNNENNPNNNNNERGNDQDDIVPPNFEFNLINPMGSINVENVEIDFSIVNVDDLRENLRNRNRDNANNPNRDSASNRNRDNANNSNRDSASNGNRDNANNSNRDSASNRNRDDANNRNGNDNGDGERRRRCNSNENSDNQQNDRPNQHNQRDGPEACLVDCIKIDQLIDVTDVRCGRQNEVIVIASSSRPKNEPSTSKENPDDSQKAPNTKKPESQGYVHFRRNQDPVYVNINREESKKDSESNKGETNDGNQPVSNDVIEKDGLDENKMDTEDVKVEKIDDSKPGPSDKPVNEGASTSKVSESVDKEKRTKKGPVKCPPGNVQRREPLPPVQYHIEPRHHVLYVGVGPQLNTYRFPRDSSDLLRHLNFRPSHVDASALVTDFSMRRFGRADSEDVNIIHIDGPMFVGQAAGSRPDRSSLRFLSVTGYRNITDRSLVHLATAAPNLSFIDFSGTSVTENGAENFRSLRPECDIVFSQFHDSEDK